MSYYSDTSALFDCFDEPVMQNVNPNLPAMMLAVIKRPSVIGKMRPISTLENGLAKQFSDTRLRATFWAICNVCWGNATNSTRVTLANLAGRGKRRLDD